MTKTADLEAHIEELTAKLTDAATRLRDAWSAHLTAVSDLPGNENVDTSAIDAAVSDLADLANLESTPEPAPADAAPEAPAEPATDPATGEPVPVAPDAAADPNAAPAGP